MIKFENIMLYFYCVRGYFYCDSVLSHSYIPKLSILFSSQSLITVYHNTCISNKNIWLYNICEKSIQKLLGITLKNYQKTQLCFTQGKFIYKVKY